MQLADATGPGACVGSGVRTYADMQACTQACDILSRLGTLVYQQMKPASSRAPAASASNLVRYRDARTHN